MSKLVKVNPDTDKPVELLLQEERKKNTWLRVGNIEVDTDPYHELCEALDSVCDLFQLEKPDPIIIQDIARIVIKGFPNLSKTQIMDAFDKYSIKKFEVGIEHYGKFRPDFVGGVLKAYDKYVKNIQSEWDKEEAKPKKAPRKEEVGRLNYQWVVDHIKAKGELPTAPWDAIGVYMFRQGFFECTEDETTQFRVRCVATLRESATDRIKMADIETYTKAKEILGNERLLKFHCAGEFAKDYLLTKYGV